MAKPQKLTDPEHSKHLLRRLTFSATNKLFHHVENASVLAATRSLIDLSGTATTLPTPAFAEQPWTNPALRFKNMSAAVLAQKDQLARQRYKEEASQLEQEWLDQLVTSSTPLRESMSLFFHTTFGGSYKTIGPGKAVYAHIELVRRYALSTIPKLLEAMALSPAMLIQHGYDESRRELPPYYAAEKVLAQWLVGPGNYSNSDVENLARSLTGWVLEAPPGATVPDNLDSKGARRNRRTGLMPIFHSEYFDNGEKTLFGHTGNFNAPQAIKKIATLPQCASWYADLLTDYFGIHDPNGAASQSLIDAYLRSQGDIPTLIETLTSCKEFWSESSRWNLIKSPVHLVVGACQALGITSVQGLDLESWLQACGQSLLDSPNRGAQSWTSSAWLKPSGRLTARYKLGDILLAQPVSWGMRANKTGDLGRPNFPAWVHRLPVGEETHQVVADLVHTLDPAPGLNVENILDTVNQRPTAPDVSANVIRQVLASAEYQLA
ncbi:MAG: DUF1800 family protein [Pseudomonadota bacterium]